VCIYSCTDRETAPPQGRREVSHGKPPPEEMGGRVSGKARRECSGTHPLAFPLLWVFGAYSTEFCHLDHGKLATQSTGSLPPSPREACHVAHGNVATHSR
jgi:hypothetical protein